MDRQSGFEAINLLGELVQSDGGYLPVEGESVDSVLVNEVMSHGNLSHFRASYSDVGRTLISDQIVGSKISVNPAG